MSEPLTIRPSRMLRGQAQVPSDKSISHRAAMFGALAWGTTRIRNFLQAQDCLATLRCLRALGVTIRELPDDLVEIAGQGLYGLEAPEIELDCGGSGTTMRLMSGLLAGQPFISILTGNESLQRRPMERIIEPLRRMGVDIHGKEDRLPPLRIYGGQVHGMAYHLPVASAQVKSAILLAGLYARQPTLIHEPGPARDHTERMLQAMGVNIERSGNAITLQPRGSDWPLQPLDIAVPGDFSSAAFIMVAALLVPHSKVELPNVGINPTRTGLWEVLQAMGARMTQEQVRTAGGEPVADIIVEHSPLVATGISGELVPRMIDEFPILAVAATQARGTTIVRDAAELRVKESDRITAIVSELSRLSAQIEERPDGFVIQGPTALRGATVSAHRDHRLAMSLAIAGLIASGQTIIEGADSIADSFPGFESLLRQLGGAD